MKRALVGYTGFIGSSLPQAEFSAFFNSQNLDEIRGQEFDEVWIAAPSGVKYKANTEPNRDMENVWYMGRALREVKTKRAILIGTGDSYLYKDHYGIHRRALELELMPAFEENLLILRMAMVYGPKARKGLPYDFSHGNFEFYREGLYQFYHVGHLYEDANRLYAQGVRSGFLGSEPIDVQEIRAWFGRETGEMPRTCYELYDRIPLIPKATAIAELRAFFGLW